MRTLWIGVAALLATFTGRGCTHNSRHDAAMSDESDGDGTAPVDAGSCTAMPFTDEDCRTPMHPLDGGSLEASVASDGSARANASDGATPADAARDASSTATDAGCTAMPDPSGSCAIEDQSCAGPWTCAPCNDALALWTSRQAWSCYCRSAKWQCARPPVCTIDTPNTFGDEGCTRPAAHSGP
jgi:hypothetical protein